jgi:nucleoside-diphosphate-sugar epimerase
MVRVVEAGQPERFTTYHMEGHWDPDGAAMIAAIRTAVGDPALAVRRFPWPLVRLAQPVVPLFRELAEMRYLWQQPIRMDNRRLVAAIGPEPHTPLEQAVRETLAGLGCLPAPDSAADRLTARI